MIILTNEEITLMTKQKLSKTLKQLMKQKPFNKITVSELIKECNVNRKTFYYHFQDIFELLKWTFEQEAFSIVKQYDITKDYEIIISFAYDYITNNSYIINCAYDSLGRDVLKSFFCTDIKTVVQSIIKSKEESIGIELTENFRTFLCSLYTEGIAGMIINTAQHPKDCSKEKLIEYFSIIINNSISSVIKAFNEKRTTNE